MAELIIYMALMSITPGPNTIASFINASKKGILKGLTLNAGMVTGISLIATLSYALIYILGEQTPTSGAVFQILGAIYLVYIAYKLLKTGSISFENGKTGGFITGLMMQLMNVKVLLLCITAVSSFIIPNGYGFISITLIPAICFLSQITWALFGSIIAKIYAKYNKLFNFAFSAALLYLALGNIMSLIR